MACTLGNIIVTNYEDTVSRSEKFCSHIISIPRFSVRFLLLFQIWMNVPAQHTTVVIVLFVTTLEDLITARAKMDFMEMEKPALVTICDKLWFNEYRAS